jgi:hypothetical protein
VQDEPSFIDALKSSVYHHPLKGCKLAYFGFPRKVKTTIWSKARQRMKIITVIVWTKKAKCRTHNAMLCYAEGQCLWEQGAHFGSISEGYKPPTSLD